MSKLNWTKVNKINQALNHGGFEPASNDLHSVPPVHKKETITTQKTTHGVYSDCSCRGAKWRSDPNYFVPSLKKQKQ